MMKVFAILLSLIGFSSSANSIEEAGSDSQLWIMIKTDNYFRSQNELIIVDEVTEIMESANLGFLDGHSSGAYQFEFNFYDVRNYERAKFTIQDYLLKKHPKITYTISNSYEMPYEKL